MANFSTKLVGGFVPVIVYKFTGKLELAILTLVIQYLLSFIMNLILKNLLIKYPQLFLFLRVIPIIIYEILLLFITSNPIWCAIGIGASYSLSYTFKYIPTEVLFAYINGTKKKGTGKQLAIIKVLEQTSFIAGVLIGGYVLDNFAMEYMIIISIVLYIIGALPQLIFYIVKGKKRKINTEYASYAHIVLKEKSDDKQFANTVSKKIRILYLIFYFFQESWQCMYVLLPLLTYKLTNSFTYSAVATAIFDGVYGIGCYIAGVISEKRDLCAFATFCGVIVGICGISLVFLNKELIWLFYLICGLMAFGYSFAYYFMYDRLLKKSKVIGRNTTCIINKINMFLLSTCFNSMFGLIGLPIVFFVAGGMSIVSGISIPAVEENTRRMLVDHLQDNEIKDKYKLFFFRKR